MSVALVPVIAGRPAWLRVGSAWVWVSGHDVYYLQRKSQWRARLRTLGRRNGQRLRQPSDGYRAWLKAERVWYNAIGLLPPDMRPQGRVIEAKAYRLSRKPVRRGYTHRKRAA